MLKINRKSPSGKNSPRGHPIGGKMRFNKYDHIVYQSIANFMHFQKNIKIM